MEVTFEFEMLIFQDSIFWLSFPLDWIPFSLPLPPGKKIIQRVSNRQFLYLLDALSALRDSQEQD